MNNVQKMITLNTELSEKLSQEPNASALIRKLLIEHYNSQRPEKDKIKQLEEKKQVLLSQTQNVSVELKNAHDLELDRLEAEALVKKDEEANKARNDFIMNMSKSDEKEYRKGLNKDWNSYAEYASCKLK